MSESYEPNMVGYSSSSDGGYGLAGYELDGASNDGSETWIDPLKLFEKLSLSSDGGRNSNRSWQDKLLDALALRSLENKKTAADKLDLLCMEFHVVCELYAELIILERSLPVDKKTLKPMSSLGGVAGGEKYCAAGILFKFAVDHRFESGNYLYGGESSNDFAAMRASGAERKSLEMLATLQQQAYNSCNGASNVLFSPLFATVDFKGQRMTCTSIIDGLSNETLVMGSSDGGRHVKAGDAETRSTCFALGKLLNLRPHIVQERSTGRLVELPFGADVEIHRIDGRLFVIDSARLFPPMAPLGGNPRRVFFELFRPEFLHLCSEPLSSDAFSSFAPLSEQIHENKRVAEATRKLLTERIPEVAKMMERQFDMHDDQPLMVRLFWFECCLLFVLFFVIIYLFFFFFCLLFALFLLWVFFFLNYCKRDECCRVSFKSMG